MRNLLILFALAVMVSGCLEKPLEEYNEQQLAVRDFDFKTVSETKINIELTDNTGTPLSGVLVQLWSLADNEKSDVIFKAFTGSNGKINSNTNLPTDLNRVIVETNFIGIPNNIIIPAEGGLIDFTYVNGQVTSMIVQETSKASGIYQGKAVANVPDNVTFSYLGSYNGAGVPDYLEPDRDQISATLLEYINASLPESQRVPIHKPSYLANGKKTTLDIIEQADVWITFVHEGAGFRNAIGYYTYTTGTPPQSLEDISNINVIFPNLSYNGSGGGLVTGDKVYLGQFDSGLSIGLVLLANGWDGNNSEDFNWAVFADPNLNPESDADLKQHNVLLWDAENELFLLGFEDVKRDLNWCDQDFNDAILFVTSNPVEGISIENVSPVDKPGTLDSDEDGVNDILDEYPDDPTKAYDSYYPSSTSYGTFAFEDNWPDYGDYDFNDLVIDYQFKHILNANNEVVVMEPTFKIRAIGAGFRNGFGFATDLFPSDITSATGHVHNTGYTQLNANGSEADQTNAVFVVSENVHDFFDTFGFVNTEEDDIYHSPQDVTMTIAFSSPKTYEQIGTVPYNPFLIVSGNRQREIHLPGYEPTDKVDSSLFGTLDDDTNTETGVYYRSKTDLPWAIHLPESFAYPKEKADIRQAHLRFDDWSVSLGFSYMDWYRGNSGYRSASHIYSKQ